MTRSREREEAGDEGGTRSSEPRAGWRWGPAGNDTGLGSLLGFDSDQLCDLREAIFPLWPTSSWAIITGSQPPQPLLTFTIQMDAGEISTIGCVREPQHTGCWHVREGGRCPSIQPWPAYTVCPHPPFSYHKGLRAIVIITQKRKYSLSFSEVSLLLPG